MRKHIILSYLYQGEEKIFDFDMTNKNHCDRIIATLSWAAREGVEIYCNPKTNVAEVADKQISTSA